MCEASAAGFVVGPGPVHSVPSVSCRASNCLGFDALHNLTAGCACGGCYGADAPLNGGHRPLQTISPLPTPLPSCRVILRSSCCTPFLAADPWLDGACRLLQMALPSQNPLPPSCKAAQAMHLSMSSLSAASCSRARHQRTASCNVTEHINV